MKNFKDYLNIIIKLLIAFMYGASIIGIIVEFTSDTEKGFLVYFLLFILAIISTMLYKENIRKSK